MQLPDRNDDFEVFLGRHLAEFSEDDRREAPPLEVQRVARRAFYGTHYGRLFPEPIPQWTAEDDEAERTRYVHFRTAPASMDSGLDIVGKFEIEYPAIRSRYCTVAS